MDKRTWRATVHGFQRAGHDQITKAHTHSKSSLTLESFFFFFAARGLPCDAQGFSSCSAQVSSISVHGLLWLWHVAQVPHGTWELSSLIRE